MLTGVRRSTAACGTPERREQLGDGLSGAATRRAINAAQRETLACTEGTLHCAANSPAMATARGVGERPRGRRRCARRWILIRRLTGDRVGTALL